MTMLDVHRKPPSVIGFTDREMEIIERAIGHYKVELVSQRDFCSRVDAPDRREFWARQVLELDLVRVKLAGGAPADRNEEHG